MPTITIDVEHEIEVYCATCGCGLCNSTDYTQGRTRGVDQFRVEACPDCISKLQDEISDLKYELEQAQEQINDLECDLRLTQSKNDN